MSVIQQKEILEKISKQIENITDNEIKESIYLLFSLIEQQHIIIQNLKEEIQRLRDENNRLKGEQGKPKIKPTKKDISSEKERKQHKKKKRKKKKKNLEIHDTKISEIDKSELPADAQFKGYTPSIVQELEIRVINIEFLKETYYSPSENKTYIAKVPQGFEGGFGPCLKSTVITLKNDCNVSEPKILVFLTNYGADISGGTVSNILIKDKDVFHKEKDELFIAGLSSSIYQQIDDTAARVRGNNYYMQILGNPLYSAYFTVSNKSRLTVLEILQTGQENGGKGLKYSLNEEAIDLLERLRVSKKIRNEINILKSDRNYTREEIEDLLLDHFPLINEITKTRILEAAAIAAYHNEEDYPVIKILLCDDAPQFKLLTEYLSLCWVHDGRHYKKLSPIVPFNIKKLEEFIERYWEYYRRLLEYKANPSEDSAEELSKEFDILFSTITGYKDLDERIEKTKAKKDNLLLVLKYPELPLHNNASELDARVQARKRDVSLHTMTAEGTKANDTFLSIAQTCKKLGIRFYDFIYDRITGSFKIPSLAQLILVKTEE
ncbi:MAG TPA: hypothetical protein ENI23_15135 [bacterium]|nr:hypothetical protein [bacterium]